MPERRTRITARVDHERGVFMISVAADLAAAGVPSDPSHANFVLARFHDRAAAEACDRALREDGIIVRRVAGYKLPQALRITVGDAAGCARVADSVARFMQVRA